MLVERSQVLAAVRRVERDADIVRDVFGNLPEGLAIAINLARPVRNSARERRAAFPVARSLTANAVRDPMA
jgi:hypothetical protein